MSKNAAYLARKAARRYVRNKERRATDPVYADKCRAKDRARYARRQARKAATRPPKVRVSARERRLLTYGLTLANYQSLLDEYAGACAICGRTPTPPQTLRIDFDKTLQYVRGLLCGRCSYGLKVSLRHTTVQAIAAYARTLRTAGEGSV